MAKARTGRIPALPTNWADPVVARYVYDTEISTVRDGSEQRWAHRQTPRLQIGQSSLLDVSEWTRFAADMAEGQNDVFYAPVPWRFSFLDAPSGGTTLTINTMPFWAVANALVIIEDETKMELATIASVASPTITLTGSLAGSFAAGSKVYLAQQVLVEASVEAQLPVSRVSVIGSQLIVKPGETPHPFGSVTPAQHNSIDVFDYKPNWSRSVDVSFETERGQYDVEIGRIRTFDLESFNKGLRKAQFTRLDAASAEEIVAFFDLKKGRRGSFYTPTYTADMQALIAQPSGTSGLTVEGEDFFNAYDAHPIWNTLYVESGGASQINTISSMATSGGNTVLTMADVWAFDLEQGKTLSWCPLSRFASDTLTVNWLTNEVAEMALSFVTVRNIL